MDAPDKQIELIPEAAKPAKVFLDSLPDTRMRFDRVADLVEGFETPFGMELLATVHWVATREEAGSVEGAIEATRAWNPRKQMFDPGQIRLARDVLRSKGWLPESA